MFRWLRNYLSGESRGRVVNDSGMTIDSSWISEGTLTGVAVDETTALNHSAVYAAVRVISETVASLPLPVYQRLATGGKQRAPAHPLYYLVHDEPNEETTSLQFRETMLSHCLIWGNAYAEIERSGAGYPVALWLLPPNKVKPKRDENYRLTYKVSTKDGDKTLLPENVLHVAGLGFDGLQGYSTIQLARESIGLSMAAEQFGAAFFGNSAKPSGLLSHPKILKQDAEDNLRKRINRQHQGPSNVGNLLILGEGITYQPFTMPPEDAQYLETRLFQVSEVARWFRINPIFLADLSRSTFSNGEQAAIDFVTHTIRPWCVRIEQEFNRKLFSSSERRTFYTEHLIDGLLRGDTVTRYNAYNIGRTGGWLSVNDIRNSEGMNPIDGGDIYLSPLNMVSAAPAAEPTPKPSPVEGEEQKPPTPQVVPAEVKAIALDAVKATVIDAYGRMARREATALRRAAKKPSLHNWAEEFYAEHRELLVESLCPSINAYLVVSESKERAEDVAARVAAHVCNEHRGGLLDLIECQTSEQLERAIEDIASEIETTPHRIIDLLS